MRPPRRLTAEEAAVWRKVAQTVTPLVPSRVRKGGDPQVAVEPPAPVPELAAPATAKVRENRRVLVRPAVIPRDPPLPLGQDRAGLDGSWDRKIAKGALDPDFSLDLHGAGLDAAYLRLMHGLAQAKAMGARVVLIVTGKPRPVEAADRGKARGAIRAKIGDWLAASEHAGDIAAIRGAHRRHGGTGALYVVLKKRR